MKVIYDTNVYIDLLRDSSHLDLFTVKNVVRYISPIVIMELLAGVRTEKQARTVDRLVAPYSRANRVVHLSANDYYKAGECLAKLGSQPEPFHRGLSHDVLIALSALSVGAVLYTKNKKDFSRIENCIPIQVEFL